MRNAKRTLLVAVMALAAMALAATSASANPLNIVKEPGGQACPAVTFPGAGGETDVDGGCLLHASGEAELRKHVFGIESHITECANEYHGRVNNAGEGYILEQKLTNEPGHSECTRQPCKDSPSGEAIPWHASGEEGPVPSDPEGGLGTEYLTTEFCVEPLGGGTDEMCEIDVSFNEIINVPHKYEFGHGEPGGAEMPGHGFGGFRCELVGHWISETGGTHDGELETPVEVLHT